MFLKMQLVFSRVTHKPRRPAMCDNYILPIKVMVPDILYYIPTMATLGTSPAQDPHFSYSPTQGLCEGNNPKDSSVNDEESRLRWRATEHTPVSTTQTWCFPPLIAKAPCHRNWSHEFVSYCNIFFFK